MKIHMLVSELVEWVCEYGFVDTWMEVYLPNWETKICEKMTPPFIGVIHQILWHLGVCASNLYLEIMSSWSMGLDIMIVLENVMPWKLSVIISLENVFPWNLCNINDQWSYYSIHCQNVASKLVHAQAL